MGFSSPVAILLIAIALILSVGAVGGDVADAAVGIIESGKALHHQQVASANTDFEITEARHQGNTLTLIIENTGTEEIPVRGLTMLGDGEYLTMDIDNQFRNRDYLLPDESVEFTLRIGRGNAPDRVTVTGPYGSTKASPVA